MPQRVSSAVTISIYCNLEFLSTEYSIEYICCTSSRIRKYARTFCYITSRRLREDCNTKVYISLVFFLVVNSIKYIHFKIFDKFIVLLTIIFLTYIPFLQLNLFIFVPRIINQHAKWFMKTFESIWKDLYERIIWRMIRFDECIICRMIFMQYLCVTTFMHIRICLNNY